MVYFAVRLSVKFGVPNANLDTKFDVKLGLNVVAKFDFALLIFCMMLVIVTKILKEMLYALPKISFTH